MRVIRFYESTKTLKLLPESFDDLYLIERIVARGDTVGASSYRRFRASESDIGEQKEVFVKLVVEKSELDRNSNKLRFTGKIVGGKPEEFVRISSYHTLNVGAGDTLEIQKSVWKEYILRRIKQAVQESKRPRLGVIALDDEKATVAYIRGYGIEIVSEVYSGLSKRMKEKDFEIQKSKFFDEIIGYVNSMSVEIIAIAGPGFMKENLKKYIEQKGIKLEKKIAYVTASDAERSGVREAMQSGAIAKLLEREQMKREFELLNRFLSGLKLNSSFFGIDGVRASLESYAAGVIMVNDELLNDEMVQSVLDLADRQRVGIEIFNSDDDAGSQLRTFRGIASISKQLLS